MREKDVIHERDTADPIPATTINLFRYSDNALIASPVTNAGVWTYTADGSIGPYYWKADDVGGEPIIHSSRAVGLAGPLSIGDLPLLIQGFGDGISPGVLNELGLVGTGLIGLNIHVRDGCALVRGIIYAQYTDDKVLGPFAANASGNPRKDRVVIRAWPAGHAQEGRAELAILTGTPAASPVAPSVSYPHADGYYERSLGVVTIPNGATNIVAENVVTDPIEDNRLFPPAPPSRPTVNAIGRRSGSPINVTAQEPAAGQNIPDIEVSPVLLSGITYDVFALALVRIALGSGVTPGSNTKHGLSVYIGGSANNSSYTLAEPGNTSYPGRDNLAFGAHFRSVVGSGAGLTCGALIRRYATFSGQYQEALLAVLAIPRGAA